MKEIATREATEKRRFIEQMTNRRAVRPPTLKNSTA